MTSAARPTFFPAKGNAHQGGNRLHAPTQQTSAKDQAGHTQLKLRRPGQSAPSDLHAKDLKADLEARERRHFESKGAARTAKGEAEAEEPKLLEYERTEKEENIDADDSDSSDDDDDEDDDDDDSEEGGSEDETAELMRELEKIKREREEERRKQEAEREREEAERRANEVKFGNPLLAAQHGEAATFNVKKRWYEEVVFKNQAKDEPQKKKRFINDTIRNDFHKKFLAKYIQ